MFQSLPLGSYFKFHLKLKLGERRTTFAKAYGTKVGGCYGEHVGEHIGNLQYINGNLMGTHWELEGNTVGTHREQGQNEKKKILPSHPSALNLKGKKQGTLSACLGLPIS